MCQEHLAHSENVNYFYYQRYEKKKVNLGPGFSVAHLRAGIIELD